MNLSRRRRILSGMVNSWALIAFPIQISVNASTSRRLIQRQMHLPGWPACRYHRDRTHRQRSKLVD